MLQQQHQQQQQQNQLYSCEYCDKTYTRKNAATKHFILCELLHNSIRRHQTPQSQQKFKREQQCIEEESTDIPSQSQMYYMLQELAYKYTLMETKMDEMQKWTAKTKQKLNVIQWLNSNIRPTITYDVLVNNLRVQESDIMEENVTCSIINILQRHVCPPSSETSIEPIYCFNQKQNTFYIYTKQDQWQLFTNNQFSLLLHKIHTLILGKLREWYNRNKQSIVNDDSMGVLYSKTVSKIMSVNFNQDSTALNKIKSALYNHLKVDLKKLIEYDFEF